MTKQGTQHQERLSALVLAAGSLTGLAVSAYYFASKDAFFADLAQHFSHRPIGTMIGVIGVGIFVGSYTIGLGLALKTFLTE